MIQYRPVVISILYATILDHGSKHIICYNIDHGSKNIICYNIDHGSKHIIRYNIDHGSKHMLQYSPPTYRVVSLLSSSL